MRIWATSPPADRRVVPDPCLVVASLYVYGHNDFFFLWQQQLYLGKQVKVTASNLMQDDSPSSSLLLTGHLLPRMSACKRPPTG